MEFFHALRKSSFLTFSLGALLAWGLETFFSQIFQTEGVSGLALLALILLAAAVIFQAGHLFIGWIWPTPPMRHGEPPRLQPGLIVLLSTLETYQLAVRFHQSKLKYLWLVVTPESAGLVDEAKASLASSVQLFEQPIQSAWDSDETAKAMARILHHVDDLSLSRESLICDITGGTKAMTVGAIVACIAEGIKAQMVAARYNETLKKPVPTDIIEIRLV